jgi:hypothetical protein
MRFKTWIEGYEAGEGQTPTPASDEVIKTGLQPQVGTEKIAQDAEDLDQLQALDSHIQRFTLSIRPELRDDSEAGKLVNSLVDDLNTKWKQFKDKKKDESPDNKDKGLGSADDSDFRKEMESQPNAVPPQPQDVAQGPGPGIFGGQ